jgi:hypothetical protein
MSKGASARSASAALGSLPSPPASLPTHRIRLTTGGKANRDESAIDDDQNDEMEDDEATGFKQARNRRASEGLKCDKCGKGYKHSSCLSKHLCVVPRYPCPEDPIADLGGVKMGAFRPLELHI